MASVAPAGPVLILLLLSAVSRTLTAGISYGPLVKELTPENIDELTDDGSCSKGCSTTEGRITVIDIYAAW